MADNSARLHKIIPFLWFDNEAEEAARFYTAIFKNSRIVNVVRYNEAGQEVHGGKPASVMTVAFELEGQRFTALNGGPIFKFNESISFVVQCADQKEVDYFWSKLSEGGDPNAQQCGWLKDRFGVSWQIVPSALIEEMLTDTDTERAGRVMKAVLTMKKIEIAELKRAYDQPGSRS